MTIAVQTPTLSRRKLLSNAGSLAAAISVASVPALASKIADVAENPKLLALEPQIKVAEAKFLEAMTRYQEAYEAGSKLWPRAPEAAWGYQRDTSKYAFCGLIERDIAGYGIKEEGRNDYRNIVTAWFIKNGKPTGTKAIAAWKKRLSEVQTYERACKRAKRITGITKLAKAHWKATEELEKLISAAMKEPARTMEGVMVQARVLQTYRIMETRRPTFSLEARFWGAALGDALLAVLPQT